MPVPPRAVVAIAIAPPHSEVSAFRSAPPFFLPGRFGRFRRLVVAVAPFEPAASAPTTLGIS